MRVSIGFVARNLKYNLLYAGEDLEFSLLCVPSSWQTENELALRHDNFCGTLDSPKLFPVGAHINHPEPYWTFHEVFMESAD